jgi:L-amino acid N-acyltransferase YncA
LDVVIRPATDADWDEMWEIMHPIIARGETYTYDPAMTSDEARARWLSRDVQAYVAEIDRKVVGTYILKANQPALGAHVANCGYMVAPGMSGHGIGRAMCVHSLNEARRAGYLAMQFNFVVSTNTRAVRLWQDMGFAIVGTLPKVFRHREAGLVDAYVMHRFL